MKTVVKEIGSGDSAIDKTVKEMWRLINEDVRDEVVIAQARKLRGSDEFGTLENVYRYVINNFKYKSDPPGIEHFTRPKFLIQKKFDKYLDCDDMVGILAALLLANRIPVKIKVIAWRRHEYTHVILMAKHKNMWIPLDAVQGSAGFGNQIRKVIREKKYNNPMGQLVTLEDGGGCCGGGGGGGRSRGGRGDNTNNNVIMIGNTQDTREMQLHKKHDFDIPRPVESKPQKEVQIKEIVKEVEKRVPVPMPVIRTVRVKSPVRAIASQPAVVYKEFY